MSDAEPVYHTDRSDNYARQKGITPGIWPWHMTPRQSRRFWRKLRRQVGGPREYYGEAGRG